MIKYISIRRAVDYATTFLQIETLCMEASRELRHSQCLKSRIAPKLYAGNNHRQYSKIRIMAYKQPLINRSKHTQKRKD